MELVPGDDNYLSKKTFDWQVKLYDKNSMQFKVTFDHPEYVSSNSKIDTLKLKFANK